MRWALTLFLVATFTGCGGPIFVYKYYQDPKGTSGVSDSPGLLETPRLPPVPGTGSKLTDGTVPTWWTILKEPILYGILTTVAAAAGSRELRKRMGTK